jgi:PAS domain S-box-containing protein
VRNVNLFAVMFDSNSEIIYCNGHFLRMTGLSLDEVLGRRWNEVFASPLAEDLAVDFAAWLNCKPDELHYEGDLLSREGEHYRVRWNTIPVRDSSGTRIGAASVGEDITECR